MTQYATLLYGPDLDWSAPEQTADLQPYAEFGAAAAAVMRGGAALYPTSTATTVNLTQAGDVVTTDGPFAETKEVLTGFYLLECADLDEAIRWAAQIPSAKSGRVEVRPVIDFGAAPAS